jgi:hypothetical protein
VNNKVYKKENIPGAQGATCLEPQLLLLLPLLVPLLLLVLVAVVAVGLALR